MDLHTIYLEESLNRLEEIHEDARDLEAILKEPSLFKKGQSSKQCDLITIHHKYYNLLEYKAHSKTARAYEQMWETHKWFQKHTSLPLRDMKMILYHDGLYEVHYIAHNGNYIGQKLWQT
jgi:hypothetical protein